MRTAVSKRATPEKLSKLYDAIGLELRYTPDDQVVHVSTTLRVANECVRGRTCSLTLRLDVWLILEL